MPPAVFAVVREEAPAFRGSASPEGSPRPGLPPPATAPKLLDRVREVLRFKHYSLRTEEAYTGWIRRYLLFHAQKVERSEEVESQTGRKRDSEGGSQAGSMRHTALRLAPSGLARDGGGAGFPD